ncbi:MAG: DUF4282 domain-containing protein [Gordonia sp. (in: high G+C Gram-positive bacteria)]|uniref:DUF4282 domain-containing protein n=1 Tax=Gordonia sp. (in: high G+C Gram-positive bacteria) TaxID=84139 RepID=UPI0039E638F5
MTDPTPPQPEQPQYGQPGQYGQPQYPAAGQPIPEQPQYEQPQYAQPQYGQPVAGAPIDAQQAAGQPVAGQHPGFFTEHPQFQQVEQKGEGLLAGLFDLKFVKLIGLKVLPLLYALSLILITVGAVLAAIGLIINGFYGGGIDILIGLVLGLVVVPFLWLLHVVFVRILYELFISIFKIADNSRQIAENTAKAE